MLRKPSAMSYFDPDYVFVVRNPTDTTSLFHLNMSGLTDQNTTSSRICHAKQLRTGNCNSAVKRKHFIPYVCAQHCDIRSLCKQQILELSDFDS